MYHNRKGVSWRLIGLLLVLPVSISLLVMSPMLTFAATTLNPVVIPIPNRNNVFLGVWRPTGSTVGSVHITLNSGKIDQCINLGNQSVIYGFGSVSGNDTVVIDNYSGANCQGATSRSYRGTVNSLVPGSTGGTYRVYMTPVDA